MKLDIMGLQFDNVTMDEAAARAEQILAGDRTCYAVTPNAEIAYEALEKTGGGLFLLGSKPGIAELAAQKMLEKHPKLHICGMNDGYFKDEAPIIEKINAARPDVLFVCLGAPKQELFMKDHLDALHVKLMIGLGGSLDSFAGTVKRAPKWMIRCNLEWLYRLIKEPKRFGRMLRLPKYLFAVLGKRIRG